MAVTYRATENAHIRLVTDATVRILEAGTSGPITSTIIEEDGSSHILLEDGSSHILLE